MLQYIFTPHATLHQRNAIHEIAFGEPPQPPDRYAYLPNMDKVPLASQHPHVLVDLNEIQMLPPQSMSNSENGIEQANVFENSLEDMVHNEVTKKLSACENDDQNADVRKLLKNIIKL